MTELFGIMPSWLAQRAAKTINAGGIGQRALGLFGQQGIQVVMGAAEETPESLVNNYLTGNLQLGENICDH